MLLRMVDVTENIPEKTTVTTMAPFVGPRKLTQGLGGAAIVFDSLGVAVDLALRPTIKCGNQRAFLNKSFSSWLPSGDWGSKAILGPVFNTYNLSRAAAAKGSPKFPWRVMVQKIMVRVQLEPMSETATAIKQVSCARPIGSTAPYQCCVDKSTSGPGNITTQQEALLFAALLKM